MSKKEIRIEDSWHQKLEAEFQQPYFENIKSFLKQEKAMGKIIHPPGPAIFRAFDNTPFHAVKVVILGQDPYHQAGQAMGLSFSVPKGVRIPPSLKNIYKELNRDMGIPVPAHGDLSAWSHQGVFLLNAMLSVENNKAGSHKSIGWQSFTDAVIKSLSEQRSHLVFLLWGNFAKEKAKLVDHHKHLVLTAAHPSPLAGNAFQGCGHFSKANEYLSSHGIKPIDWRLDV